MSLMSICHRCWHFLLKSQMTYTIQPPKFTKLKYALFPKLTDISFNTWTTNIIIIIIFFFFSETIWGQFASKGYKPTGVISLCYLQSDGNLFLFESQLMWTNITRTLNGQKNYKMCFRWPPVKFILNDIMFNWMHQNCLLYCHCQTCNILNCSE